MSDLSSGHDITVREFEPHDGLCAVIVEPAWDPFSFCLPLPHSFSLFLSLSFRKINKTLKTIFKKMKWLLIVNHSFSLSLSKK